MYGLFSDPMTTACQAPHPWDFPVPFPSPGDLPNPGIEPVSPTLAGRFFFFFTTVKPNTEIRKKYWVPKALEGDDSGLL